MKQELESDDEDNSSQYFNGYYEPDDPNIEQEIACKVEPEDEIIYTEVEPSMPPIKLNFCCDKCRHRTDSRIKLEFHMLSAHSDNDGSFECPVCSKVFDVKSSFSRHFYEHREDTKSLCPR